MFYDKTPNKSSQKQNPAKNPTNTSNTEIHTSSPKSSRNKRPLSTNLLNSSRFVIDSDDDDESVEIVTESKKRPASEIVQSNQKRTKTARGMDQLILVFKLLLVYRYLYFIVQHALIALLRKQHFENIPIMSIIWTNNNTNIYNGI